MADELRSTLGQVSDFVEGFVWQDMKHEIEVMLRNALDNLSIERNMDEVRIYQGRIDALRHVLDLPTILQEALQLQEEEQNTKQEENEQWTKI